MLLNTEDKQMKPMILLAVSLTALMSSPAVAQDPILLTSVGSKKCAHVQAGSSDNGARIIQWDCGRQNYFLWKKRNVDGAYFYLVNAQTNKCAQVDGASKENGAGITQQDCKNQSHFHWTQADAERGTHYIVNRASDKCMHVHGGSNDNGGVITQWECVKQNNVRWSLDRPSVRIDP
jgi:hypothetical protein